MYIAMISTPDNWLYDKKQLKAAPSVLDGIDQETEVRYRREGVAFILNIGDAINFKKNSPGTLATAAVFFHRFFMLYSFKDYSRYVVALGCLFLAGKVEETPKKAKDVIAEAEKLLTAHQFAAFGNDPKEELLKVERLLLQTMRFDLQIVNPFEFLVRCIMTWRSGDKTKVQGVVQNAGTFLLDSLSTTLCLQYESELIVISALYLAVRLMSKNDKFEVVEWTGRRGVRGEKWWHQFVEGLPDETVEEIAHQMLDLYSPKQAQESKKQREASAVKARSASVSGAVPSTPNINGARPPQPQIIVDYQRSVAIPPPPPMQYPNNAAPATGSLTQTGVPVVPSMQQPLYYSAGISNPLNVPPPNR